MGYGVSPLVQTLQLDWTYAPTPGKVQGQGGGWQEESISGCGLARDHTPPVGAQRIVDCGRRSGLDGIGDEFRGPYGLTHFTRDQFEKGKIQSLVVVRFVLSSSPLLGFGQDLQKKKVIGTVTRRLAFPSELVSEGDQRDRSHRIPVATVVPDRDVHRARSIKNFLRKVHEPRFPAKFRGKPPEVLLADHGNDVYGIS